MKKILSVVILFLAGTFLFAQSAAYKAHLKKAKDFEKEKKWVYALASYYDAMEAEPTAAGLDAYEGYKALEKTLISGKPGYGEFDEFDCYDGWKAIAFEYKDYWEKTCPWDFYFSKLKKGINNYENKTTQYSISWERGTTYKYSNVTSVLEEGYRIARKDDWNDYKWYYEGDFQYFIKPYFVTFEITDKANKVLISNFTDGRYEANYHSKFNSVYVTQDIAAQLKDDNIKIKISELSYGNKYSYNEKDIEKTPVDIKKARYYSPYKTPEKPVNALELLTIEKLKKTPSKLVTIPGKNYKVMNSEVTQKLYKSVMKENPSKHQGDYYPVENVSFYDAIYFCNLLSVKQGYTPVYEKDGESDVTKWGYTPHKGKSISGISQNLNADGYRLPTKEEWDFAANGTKYSNAYSWNSDNSGNTTHMIMQKLPNKYGLYDMYGNVREYYWTNYSYAAHYAGGSYEDRNANWNSMYMDERRSTVGIRLVRTIIKS